MPSLRQLNRGKIRKQRIKKLFKPALQKCPQKKALCLKVVIRSPKKPNSARRQTARVLIPSNGYRVYFSITGIGHSLQKFSNVLLRGGRRRDLPGVRYVAIRGKYDFVALHSRRKARSKYGARRFV
jgi:small subunit ribosomal protein S12